MSSKHRKESSEEAAEKMEWRTKVEVAKALLDDATTTIPADPRRRRKNSAK